MKKLLKMNNQTISNLELLQIRYNNDYIGLETIKQINDKLRLVLVHLRNDNYITLKVYS